MSLSSDTMTLNDYVTGSELILHHVDSDELRWSPDHVIPTLTRVEVIHSDAQIDMGNCLIVPESTIGMHIVGGSGAVGQFELFYPEFVPNSRGVQVDGEYTITTSNIANCQLGVLLQHFGSKVEWCEIKDIEEDHIRSMSGFVSIENNRCEGHTDYGSENHRDCIQVVAGNYSVGSDGFLSNPILGVKIIGNDCISEHPTAQGIMFSDGVAVDWEIDNNAVNVPSTHGITINRGQSIRITNNLSNAPINIGSNKKMLDESNNIFLDNNMAEVVLVNCGDEVLTEQSSTTTSEVHQDLHDLEPSTR